MRDTAIQIDPQLWNQFVRLATKRGKKPQALLSQMVRNYLETESDLALFQSMRQDVRGRELSDAEAVTFVRQQRRNKRHAKTMTRSV